MILVYPCANLESWLDGVLRDAKKKYENESESCSQLETKNRVFSTSRFESPSQVISC
jgi:hypothetical protein